MIHMERLTKYYGNLCAVSGIDLEIRRGEITGLLGPNGAGKTTTLRMLTGYIRPTSGTIRVNDLSIDTDMVAIKKHIGYLPESAPLYPTMLVYDYLRHVGTIKGLKGSDIDRRIHTMAELCGLEGIMHRSIGELSKGLKQRVGLAHAMIDDPEILVLDEPTSGLDPNQIAQIRDIIRSIGADKTVILSTHILSEAEATCDRIVIIDKGKIVADGSPGKLTEASGGEHTIHLIVRGADYSALASLLKHLEGITSLEEEPSDREGETRITVKASGPNDPREAIYRRIRETDWILVEMSREGRSLESVFRDLTREA